MIIFNNIKTYNFEDKDSNRIHIPRIYANDYKQIFLASKILSEKTYLNNSEMTEETARIRAEHIREILILLWRLETGIKVVRENKNYAFKKGDLFNQELLKEKNFLKYIKERLKFYTPVLSVLNVIYNLNKKNEEWDEKKIEKIFHHSDAKGNSDNIHPLIRWLKGLNFINKKHQVTAEGIKYLNKIKKLNPHYVHEIIDLNNDKLDYIVIEIFHHLSLTSAFKFPIKFTISDLINFDFLSQASVKFLKDNFKDIKIKIKNLINKNFPIELKEEEIIINCPIFFDLKPKNYITYQLNKFFREKKDLTLNKTHSKSINFNKDNYILIKDEDHVNNKSFYPLNTNKISYSEFIENKNTIIDNFPKFIIFGEGWKPIKNIKISGYIIAYVKNGGNLIIIGGEGGRIGANMNMYSWLPYELSKINYLKTNKNNYFKFTFGKNLSLCKLIDSIENANAKNCYEVVSFNYFAGTITFVNNEDNKDFSFNKNIFSNNALINSKSKDWTNCEIIHQSALIKPERKMYPILKEFMKNNFNFLFHEKILGNSGQTDIFMTQPFNCLFEVDTVGTNQSVCASPKVTEVDRHYKKMKKLNYFKESGKCVIAYEYSSISGDDRDGTIETAKNYKVNLIRYKDLYDMSSMKLSSEDLYNIIYNYDENCCEVSMKIIKFYEKNKNI